MWIVWKKTMVMKMDNLINQICPMCEDEGKSILTQILGMQPCTINMGEYMQCIVYELVYDIKKPSQVLALMQWKQCVLHDVKKV
jgi:hypothetical protein